MLFVTMPSSLIFLVRYPVAGGLHVTGGRDHVEYSAKVLHPCNALLCCFAETGQAALSGRCSFPPLIAHLRYESCGFCDMFAAGAFSGHELSVHEDSVG